MFHALSSPMEESFFADNMSTMIALAPCIEAQDSPELTYDNFINTNWNLYPEFHVLMDESFNSEDGKRLEQLCEKSSEAMCMFLKRQVNFNLQSGEARRAPTDLRSLL